MACKNIFSTSLNSYSERNPICKYPSNWCNHFALLYVYFVQIIVHCCKYFVQIMFHYSIILWNPLLHFKVWIISKIITCKYLLNLELKFFLNQNYLLDKLNKNWLDAELRVSCSTSIDTDFSISSISNFNIAKIQTQ